MNIAYINECQIKIVSSLVDHDDAFELVMHGYVDYDIVGRCYETDLDESNVSLTGLSLYCQGESVASEDAWEAMQSRESTMKWLREQVAEWNNNYEAAMREEREAETGRKRLIREEWVGLPVDQLGRRAG